MQLSVTHTRSVFFLTFVQYLKMRFNSKAIEVLATIVFLTKQVRQITGQWIYISPIAKINTLAQGIILSGKNKQKKKKNKQKCRDPFWSAVSQLKFLNF